MVIEAMWQTDRYPFLTEPVAGFEDSSNLDIVGAHRQVKRVCTGIQVEDSPSQTRYTLRRGRGRLEGEFYTFLKT
jgi:hypothetical protein